MNKTFTLRWASMLLALTLPSLCWGVNALIVQDGTVGIEADVMGNLTTKLTTAGYTVTNNVGVPAGSLAAYQQIWDIRFNNTTPLTPADISAYVTYMAGGRSLFVMGENTGFITRDNSIVTLISTAGGGTINIVTPTNTETVEPPFTGPTPLSTITFLAAAGSTQRGNGQLITIDSSNFTGASLVFAPGTMSNATAGSLIIVFDVNFLQAGADANSQIFTNNLIAYLATPTPVGPPLTPAPSTIILVLIGLGAAAYYTVRRRRMGQIQA